MIAEHEPQASLRAAVILAAICCSLAYAWGLGGPFVLDDHVNLAPIAQWLSGQRDTWSAVVDNRSGPIGRPVAYLSFLANAAIDGMAPLGYKLVNLVLHLAVGALVFETLRRILRTRAPARGPNLTGLAVSLAALWLLHPLHVSSVLYVVQRMALLGALAQLGAVLAYLQGRALLDTDPARARAWLFAAFPAIVAVGMLAKETAALAPLLCAVVEFTLFANTRRPRDLTLFFSVFLAVPLLIGLAYVAFDPGRILGGYVGREFTLTERLLSQPRALLEQAMHWFWPAQLGLYRDGFPPSRDLFTPPSTLFSIGLWSGLALAAVLTRRRLPLFAFGILWFLAGHALEAGPIALEPYFEHRNYLPSLGLLLAATALAWPLLQRWPTPALQSVAVSLCLVLTLLTAFRSHQWADIDRLLANEGPPPGEISRRLQIDRAIRAFERGDADARERALAELDRGPAGHRAAAALWRVVFACDGEGRVSPGSIDALVSRTPAVLTHSHVSWLWLLARRAAAGRCTGLATSDAQRVIESWENGARQPLPGRAQRQLPRMYEELERAAPGSNG